MLTYGIPPEFRGGVHLLWVVDYGEAHITSEHSNNTTELQQYVFRAAHDLHKEHIYRCMCMVTHIARVRISRVRLPILLMVSWTGKINISLSPFAFAPENIVSRDGLGSFVPRQPVHLHTPAESGAYIRDSSRVPRRRLFLLFI